MVGPVPVVRDDGKTVGRVRPVGEAWVPETIFGGVLGETGDFEDASELVLTSGMAALIEPWWIEENGVWERVELVEIQADRVRVRSWSPYNLAIGSDAAAGDWVDPVARPLFLREPR